MAQVETLLTWNLILVELNPVVSYGPRIFTRALNDAMHVHRGFLFRLIRGEARPQEPNRVSAEAGESCIQHEAY